MLYPYQKDIVDKARQILRDNKAVYIALEMRLGKSVIALELAKSYQSILFVTTKSAIEGIIDTMDKMDLPLYMRGRIFLINYESVHKIPKSRYDLIILDEAHKLGKFPKPCIAYKRLKPLSLKETNIIYLSGTPNIESSSQMYHQLSLSKSHLFSQYSTFYKWHNYYGIEHYVRRYGGMLAKDYSITKEFGNEYEHLMIRMTREQANFAQHDVDVTLHHVDIPDDCRKIYEDIRSYGITKVMGKNIVDDGSPTTKLIKLHQIAGGTVIDNDGDKHILSKHKLSYFDTIDKEKKIAVYCKYVMEKSIIKAYLDTISFKHTPIILQIDANNTGVDLSHLDEMIIYSLTFSGSNYAQVLSRMSNKNRVERIKITVLMAKNSIDQYIYDAVSQKKNFNSSYLRRKK